MSGYILCQTKRAKLPYFIENISTNVYSIEELCYYLYHNLYLVDQTIMNEGLCSWIQSDCPEPLMGHVDGIRACPFFFCFFKESGVRLLGFVQKPHLFPISLDLPYFFTISSYIK